MIVTDRDSKFLRHLASGLEAINNRLEAKAIPCGLPRLRRQTDQACTWLPWAKWIQIGTTSSLMLPQVGRNDDGSGVLGVVFPWRDYGKGLQLIRRKPSQAFLGPDRICQLWSSAVCDGQCDQNRVGIRRPLLLGRAIDTKKRQGRKV